LASATPAPDDDDDVVRFFKRQGPVAHPQPAHAGMKIAWAREFRAAGRAWLVTPELLLVPKDRVRPAGDVRERGRELDDELTLPLAMLDGEAPRFRRDGDDLVENGSWPARVLLPMRAVDGRIERLFRGGRPLAVALDGLLLDTRGAHLFELRPPPEEIGPGDKWVHVRVNQGTLTAYEGSRPVFAALISPGVEGAMLDGELATRPGRFRVDSKWLTSTMGGSAGRGSWRVREVPWVAYYDGSNALHGAWWHDRFGRPSSRGCVNLTPADARWLFGWLDPQLPRGWYAVRAGGERARGTLVVVQP
jgi:hypothetical protein